VDVEKPSTTSFLFCPQKKPGLYRLPSQHHILTPCLSAEQTACNNLKFVYPTKKGVPMQKLVEQVLTATWKSYKTFKHSGQVRLHTPQNFKEIQFAHTGGFSLKDYRGGKAETLLQTEQWTLEFKKRSHYVVLPQQKLTYEIITVNHTVLVLLDNTWWEKIFFAKEDFWRDHLQSNETITM
jgi:hypothetical protein